MPAPREALPFALPRARRAPWWLWLVAIVAHVPVLWILDIVPHGYDPDARPFRLVDPLIALHAPAEVEMIYRPDRATPAGTTRRVGVVARSVPDVTAPVPTVTVPTSRAPEPLALIPAPTAPAAADTGRPGRRGRLTPAYGSGRPWVTPLPMAPREIAATLTGKSQADVADSTVAALVQAYLDAIALERANTPPALPSWTARIGSKTVGIDSKWIYLGPVKVPTVLLGLLPINFQGNPTQAEINKRLGAMKEDLFTAARRAANLDEFKKSVKQLREERQADYDFKRNQRTPPPDSTRIQ